LFVIQLASVTAPRKYKVTALKYGSLSGYTDIKELGLFQTIIIIIIHFFIFIIWLRCQNPCHFSETYIVTTKTALFHLSDFKFRIIGCDDVESGGKALTLEVLRSKQTVIGSIRFLYLWE
jgi:hypothetical protein